jgi:hypothetical protein
MKRLLTQSVIVLEKSLAMALALSCASLWSCASETRPGGGGGANVVKSAQLTPNPAYASNRIEVTLAGKSRVKPENLRVRWLRNGTVIEGVSGVSLSTENFRKGDEISAEVSLHDSTGTSKPFRLSPVRILNTPPRIQQASTILQTSRIKVDAQSTDIDSDAITYAYRWFRNNEEIDGQAGEILDPSVTRKGDRIHAEITASDGESSSAPIAAEPVMIENHAPRITSMPPKTTSKERVFSYPVEADDLDSDPLVFEIVAGPRT